MSQRPRELPRADVDAFLSQRPGWAIREGALFRTYELASFPSAIAFVVAIGFEAERRDHHPDLSIAYKRVSVALVTHDAGGLTELDLALAAQIDALYARA